MLRYTLILLKQFTFKCLGLTSISKTLDEKCKVFIVSLVI